MNKHMKTHFATKHNSEASTACGRIQRGLTVLYSGTGGGTEKVTCNTCQKVMLSFLPNELLRTMGKIWTEHLKKQKPIHFGEDWGKGRETEEVAFDKHY
jgi:hypothetical protein